MKLTTVRLTMRLNGNANISAGEFGSRTATLIPSRASRKRQPREAFTESGDRQIPVMISAKQLSVRWACSVSSCHRISREAGFARYVLGTGKSTAMVRFLLSEVEAYESARRA
jgi:hypothetical protein